VIGSPTQLVLALLQLQRQRDTGLLAVNAENVTTLVYFNGGRLVYAEEGALGETLGRLLVQSGALAPEQYAHAVDVMKAQTVNAESPKMGEVLVQLGYVTVETVQRGLIAQVRRRVSRLIEWERLAWDFDHGDEYLVGIPSYPMRAERLVLEGIRLFYDEARMTALLQPYLAGHLMLRATVDLIAGCFALTPAEHTLLATIDGSRTTQEWLTERAAEGSWALATALAMTGVLAVADTPPSTRSIEQAAGTNDSLVPPPPSSGPCDEPVVRRSPPAPAPAAEPEVESAPDSTALKRLAKLGAESAFQRGLELLDEERFEAAAEEFARAVRGVPNATEYLLHEVWARCRCASSPDGALICELEQAAMTMAKQDSQHGLPPYVLGHVALARGNEDMANRYFKVAALRDRRYGDALRQARALGWDVTP